ncbi:MAG: HTTM domain-containing protein [Polyangiaceae bacterium]|nr:HTTM domain-containing protein [Polyangiaceae bacterium]
MTNRFTLWERISERLTKPVDPSGLAAFRFAFGLIGAVSATRFLYYGWVQELFIKPKFYFSYYGFEWVRVAPPSVMIALFAALIVVSLMVAFGLFFRAAAVLFFLGFSYVQLIDVTNYLNHYYLVSLISLLMALLPMNAAYSLDARLFRRVKRDHVPAAAVYLLRFQIGVVYTFAGLAKVNADWLLHGHPLELWLAARTGLPILGPLFAIPGMAVIMSWAGCLFDLTIAGWLSWSRSRPYAYAVVFAFHLVTSALFPIGMFPLIMTTAALIFFPPSWPRDLARKTATRLGYTAEADRSTAPAPLPSKKPQWLAPAFAVFCVYAAFQVLFPFRTHLYGGNVLWHEQGMRWSWRVMLREKNASVTYRVENLETGKVVEVPPRKYLTPRQERDFSTQPDMILQLGQKIAADYRLKLSTPVKVTAEVLVSLNGRRAALLIDPTVDLTQIQDSPWPANWINPMPAESPPDLTPVAMR